MTSAEGRPGVLVGVDGSDPSTSAVEWAAREAVLHKVPLRLVHIVQWPAGGVVWAEVSAPPELAEQLRRNGVQVLKAARKVAEDVIGDAVEIRADEVEIAENVVAALAAKSEAAQLVVVGCRGLGPIGRRLLGSVTAGLIRHARCPVAVIHHESRAAAMATTAPVVVGIDGSPASEKALAFAFDEASRRGAPLLAVHAWSDAQVAGYPGVPWDDLRVQAEERLAERLAGWRERYPDVHVQREVVLDRPDRRLLKRSQIAQLTVVGSHGRGGFVGLLLGSVSTSVAEAAERPVVVVRG
ncbi:universal stress protein [Mycolicibacterium goodii]|uniref:Universal stress protein n=1 Tax=Mycolicibacterium goodii TaxID=134601 RepID=A0A0K0X8Y0_MYCGD|nr:universal stress protein [Mycolicibacterium goodii]